MTHIITGSVALNAIYPNSRDPKDLDIMSYLEEQPKVDTDLRVEYHRIPKVLYRRLEKYVSQDRMLNDVGLYTLKLSHVFWPIWHDKTIFDIISFQRRGIEHDLELFLSLKSYHRKLHGNKDFMSLNRSKAEFFDDYVKKEVDHDLIHEWVSKYDTPLYQTCLKDGHEVMIDWDKFKAMAHEDQIHMVREEMMSIGIERFGIPSRFKRPSGQCFHEAAKLTMTNLIKGKFANFAAFNLAEILDYNMKTEYYEAKELFNETRRQHC